MEFLVTSLTNHETLTEVGGASHARLYKELRQERHRDIHSITFIKLIIDERCTQSSVLTLSRRSVRGTRVARAHYRPTPPRGAWNEKNRKRPAFAGFSHDPHVQGRLVGDPLPELIAHVQGLQVERDSCSSWVAVGSFAQRAATSGIVKCSFS